MALKQLAWSALGVGAALVLSLSLPVEGWRTGRPDATDIATATAEPPAAWSRRVWIDTDAACGHSARTDADDCFALLLLLMHAPELRIVGVSTVGGNAPAAVVDATVRALFDVLATNGAELPPLHSGAAVPSPQDSREPIVPAEQALQAALAEGPLTIVALGPLTHVAAALSGRRDLQAHVERVVAVMGRRRGHLFHPIEGGAAHSWLGHGPVFRDFNVAADVSAAEVAAGFDVPLVLVPYDAAREITIEPRLLERMRERGGAASWVAERAAAWLRHWREDIGLPGFYPFDLLAATYVVEPTLLRCARVRLAVGRDAGLLGLLGSVGLFVFAPDEPIGHLRAAGRATWCPNVAPRTREWIGDRLTAGSLRQDSADHDRPSRLAAAMPSRAPANRRANSGAAVASCSPGAVCGSRSAASVTSVAFVTSRRSASNVQCDVAATLA